MKQLLIILFIFVSVITAATNYTIGSDGDYASWSELPTLNPGDNVSFKRGETFTDAIVLEQSGTSGNPITIGAYGTGADPIVSSFTSVTSWTDLGSNIWESTNTVSTLSDINIVVIDGVNTPMGRTPNSDDVINWWNVDSHSGTTQLTSTSLTGTPDWTGGEVVFKPNKWSWEQSEITNQSTSTITFDATYSQPRDDYGFFIQRHATTLDQQGEWYYNTSTNKLSIYSTTEPTSVQVPTIDNIVTVSTESYITFTDISFIGANRHAVYSSGSSDYFSISNCSINYSGICALSLSYSDNPTIEYNSVNNTNGNALELRFDCDNANINYNIINNTGIIEGVGVFSSSNETGIYANYQCDNCNVQYNTITNSGYNGIAVSGNGNSVIQYNVIDSFCILLHDGGGIYSWGNFDEILIDHNIVTNGIGNTDGTNGSTYPAHGIYIDENGENHVITNNTISKMRGTGIYFHWCNTITTNNNIIYDCDYDDFTESGIGYDCTSLNPTISMITKHNQIVAFGTDGYAFKLNSQDQTEATLLNFGVSDSNYYISPFATYLIGTLATDNQWAGEEYTFSQWQTLSSEDSNSQLSPYTVTSESDMQLVINKESTLQAIDITGVWKDVDGTEYDSSITLDGFSSKILFFDSDSPVPRKLYLYKYGFPFGYYK